MFFSPNFLIPIVSVARDKPEFAYPYRNIVVSHVHHEQESIEDGIRRAASRYTHLPEHNISVVVRPYSMLEIRHGINAENSVMFTIGCVLASHINIVDWHTCPLNGFLEGGIRRYALQRSPSFGTLTQPLEQLATKIKEVMCQQAAMANRQLSSMPTM